MSDIPYAVEVETLANERFAAVGGSVLVALGESGLSPRRVANVVSWFIMAQLALGPWRSRGEVRPAELARAMGVSRWTEWRTRADAVSAGIVQDWTLPEDEARGYGRGAVRVLELAFVRTRQVTKRVAVLKEERATRADRRRAERDRIKRDSQKAPVVHSPSRHGGALRGVPDEPPLRAEDLVGPAAGRLWELIERVRVRQGSGAGVAEHQHTKPPARPPPP